MAWHNESKRHSLASKGIKTSQKLNPIILNNLNNYNKGWSMKGDVPIVDYPEKYGFESKLIYMSPREFLKKAQSGYLTEESKNMDEATHRMMTEYTKGIERIKEGLIEKKGKVPIAWLEVTESGRLEHEGRNRAWASIDLGIKKIPVKILWKKEYNNKPNWI